MESNQGILSQKKDDKNGESSDYDNEDDEDEDNENERNLEEETYDHLYCQEQNEYNS